MKSLSASKSFTPWQIDRKRMLLNVFTRIDGAILRGDKICKAIRRASHYYHGRKYKADPRRRIQLAPGTIRHLWDVWNHSGRNPAVFKLKYRSRPPYVPRNLMLRFAGWCAQHRLSSVRVAWKKFSVLKRNGRQTRGISYQMVCYHFRTADFYLMQLKLKISETALDELAGIKSRVIADITNRLPERAPRRRMERGNNWEI
jgi:hypothetical protein